MELNQDLNAENYGVRGGSDLEDLPRDKAKTSLRIKYEAECRVIRAKLGSLEQVREDLGLSRRKMAQLLLVDPSAWTRWTKEPEKIPPHIYRSLQWYMALIDKKPEWHPQNSFLKAELQFQKEEFSSVKERVLQRLAEMNHLESSLKEDIQRVILETKGELSEVQTVIERQGGVGIGWKFMLILNTLLLLYFIVVN